MITISGKIESGQGGAAYCLGQQLPQIVGGFPEIKDIHRGTINLRLECPLRVLVPDYLAGPITWIQRDGRPCTETFDILRITFVTPASSVRAWVYVSSGSPYRSEGIVHEIIAEEIRDLDRNATYYVTFDRTVVRLPEAQRQTICVV